MDYIMLISWSYQGIDSESQSLSVANASVQIEDRRMVRTCYTGMVCVLRKAF